MPIFGRRQHLPGSVILCGMQYMKATLIYRKSETRADGVKLDLVIG